MNKKGNIISIVYFLLILFFLMFIGFLLLIGSVVINWTFDEAVPELTSIGNVENVNFTDISGYTITPLNSFLQSFVWMSGVFYFLGLIACLGFAFAFRFTGNKYLVIFFILGMILLIIASIFVSNIYEDFYDDSGELGSRMREHTLLSYFLIDAPIILTIIGFIGGIIMFTGENPGAY